MGEQGILLEHHPHATQLWRQVEFRAGNHVAVDLNQPCVHSLKPCNEAQRRRLAASRWTQKRNQLAAADFKRDFVSSHDRGRLCAKALRYALQPQPRFGCPWPSYGLIHDAVCKEM